MAGTVLYLHGFLSSPLSLKARACAREAVRRGWEAVIPDLTMPPREVRRIIDLATEDIPTENLAVIGSSLGGFYAAWLAAKLDIPAVLINPAVHPWDFVREYSGWQTVAATGRKILVEDRFADELLSMRPAPFPRPELVLTILCTGDEVLDWTEGHDFFHETPQLVLKGNNHAVSDFDILVPAVFDFLEEGKLPEEAVQPG